MAFKMRSNPMQRNFGIGGSMKKAGPGDILSKAKKVAQDSFTSINNMMTDLGKKTGVIGAGATAGAKAGGAAGAISKAKTKK